MELDFSGLNNLFIKGCRKDFAEVQEAPETTHKDENIEISIEAIKTSVEGNNEPQKEDIGKKALINLKREQEDHKRTMGVYEEYQGNIKASGSLQADILKGVKVGEPVELLFLKAVECISRMTSNNLFYSQVKEDFIKIYGEAFQKTIPLELEIKEVQERLKKLHEYRAREDTTDGARIDRVIEAHKAKIKELESFIEE